MMHFFAPEMNSQMTDTNHPDPGDTAALEETTPGKVLAPMDDILDNLLCNLVVADTYLDRDILVADIKAFVAALVQAEREQIAQLAEVTYCGHYSEGDTSLKHFAKKVRARSTPTPQTDA